MAWLLSCSNESVPAVKPVLPVVKSALPAIAYYVRIGDSLAFHAESAFPLAFVPIYSPQPQHRENVE